MVSAQEAFAAPGRVGGKAHNLARLVDLDLPVPPFFTVTTDVFEEVRARIQAEIDVALAGFQGEREQAEAAHAAIERAFLAAGLDSKDEHALLVAFDELFAADDWVAVRSSALGEDGEKDSFAGQLDTFLYVSREQVQVKVLKCFASAYSPRVLVYRQTRGADSDAVSAAVVVQVMVEAEASGVLFTADPTTHERGKGVISAGLGLGEGVVADLVETDSIFVDLETRTVREHVVRTKDERVVFDREAGCGTRVEAVPSARAAEPALPPEALEELILLARRLDARFPVPQDCEWALAKGGTLYLLQTRPITTWLPSPGRRERIFDNSNVVEGYPNVTTPLTFSFVRRAYEVIFRKSALAFGVPKKVVEREDALFSRMVSLVDGRVYYDLLNWYKLYGLIPGFEKRVRAWEAALGLESRELEEADSLWRRLGEVPSAARGLFGMIRNLLTLDREAAAFSRRFRRVWEHFLATDLEACDAEELVELYEGMVRDLLQHWEVTTVNDFYAFQFYEILGKLLERYGLCSTGGLRNDLLCGETGMESVEPVRSLIRLASEVRESDDLRGRFTRQPDDVALWTELQGDPTLADFRFRLDRHLRLYGDRTLGELMLENPSLHEEPERLVAMIRAQMSSTRTVEEMEAHERGIRKGAEARVSEGLGMSPLRGSLLRWVLKHTRTSVKYRENLRLARTRAFGMVRRLFRRLGVLLAEQHLIEKPEDVFYLGVEEVIGAVRGGGLTRDLAALVCLRRAEFEGFREREIPGRVHVRGIAYARPFPLEVLEPIEGSLSGIGASPGLVQGEVRVVLDPANERDVAGKILVAKMTDPGWVFLMISAAGMIVERGSLLSHTAIIGRELGIPTIVGVTGATQLLETGMHVEIDGEHGTVRVLED